MTLGKAIDGVAIDVAGRLRAHLEQIAATLDSIPAESEFWDSIRETPLHIDVGGWRFVYTVDPRKRTIVVTQRKLITA